MTYIWVRRVQDWFLRVIINKRAQNNNNNTNTNTNINNINQEELTFEYRIDICFSLPFL